MVQSKICIHLLQPAVLFLQFFHAAQLLTVHAGVLLFPVIKSGLVHTQFTADVRCGLTRFMLFDRRNDLALADSCLFHRSVVKVTNSRILTSPIFWEGYRFNSNAFQKIVHATVINIHSTVLCFTPNLHCNKKTRKNENYSSIKISAPSFLLGFTTQTFSKTKNTNIMNSTKNETIGLLVIMKAKPGKEQDVKNFLLGGLALVNQEPQTVSWFAFQIDSKTFGIYDTFEVEEGRQAHLTGEVAKALLANAGDLLEDFDPSTDIQPTDVLASNHK